MAGGPPRDGIPALTSPDTVPAGKVDFLDPDDRVLGVVVGETAKAYPIKILNWHEIVNDSIGSQHYVVSYCPLCGSGMVFATNVGDSAALNFGVSGLLYNSDVLLYDRQTASLWSQLEGKAISGQLKGTPLPQLPALNTTWREWKARYPDSLVMDPNTGYRRDYDRNPHRGYEKSRRLYFKVNHQAPPTYHPKEQVLGIDIDGTYKAYPFEELSRAGKAQLSDTVAGRKITIFWNESERSAYAMQGDKVIPSTVAYWFAWFTFHPKTGLFKAESS